MDVQRYVKPVSFRPGAIVYESVEGAPIDLARRLASRLREWTGRTWLIAANGQGGGQTLIEQEKSDRAQVRAEVEADPFVASVLAAFPGAVISDSRTLAPTIEMPAIPDDPTEDED